MDEQQPRSEQDNQLHRAMLKGRLFLGMALIAGMLCVLSWILSKTAIWAARMMFFPSFVSCIVLLALYAKSTRER